MNINHLFYSDLPPGVSSICVNGKKISRAEFLELKKKFSKKNKTEL